MNRIKYLAIALIMALMVNFAVAEEAEIVELYGDACTDQVVVMRIYNDSLFTTGLKSPKGVADNTSGCPEFGLAGAEYHMNFPDTLPFVDRIMEIEGDFPASIISRDPMLTATEWWHDDVLTGTEIEIPPVVQTVCCIQGVYWKTRIQKKGSGALSLWHDSNVDVLDFYDTDTEQLYVLINTGAFKLPDGSPCEYECGDTLFFYIWDCVNEPGADSTMGEFTARKLVYSGPEGMWDDQTHLRRYGIPIGIDEKPNLPIEYSLAQNTPNPFNAATTIMYALPEDAEVRIEVTNILGNKVATIVDGWESAGFKRVVWDGRDFQGQELPSGVYFYQIKANNFNDKKRAILMK